MSTKRFAMILASAVAVMLWAMHIASTNRRVVEIRIEPAHCAAPPVIMLPRQQLAASIARRHHITLELAEQVVDLAYKYQDDTFPQAHDILTIIGIESNFRPNAKSKLKRDPAIGLTQIRPKAWSHRIKRSELSTIEGQIKHGAFILNAYYNTLENKDNAIVAYNIGLKAFQRGDDNPRYLTKFRAEYGNYLTYGES